MSLALFDRIGRLLRADAHGVVDALEERGLLVRQHLREAELAHLDKQSRLEALTDAIAQLTNAEARLAEQMARLDADVERALEGDDERCEELARFATRRWLAAGRDREQVAHHRAERVAEHAHLAEEVERQSEDLALLKDRARSFEARPASVDAPTGVGVPDEEVELELLRRRAVREDRP